MPLSYFIIFGDVAQPLVLEIPYINETFLTERAVLQIMLGLIILVLCLKKDIHKLKIASYFGVTGMSIFVITMLTKLLTN